MLKCPYKSYSYSYTLVGDIRHSETGKLELLNKWEADWKEEQKKKFYNVTSEKLLIHNN